MRNRLLECACLGLTAGVASGTGIPRPDHVVIVMEENHSYAEVIGVTTAPYINALAAGGALMTASNGITHPSQPNYVALFSGSTQGVTNDSVYPHSQFTAPNLGAKLLYAGFTFGGYSETMPSVGYDSASAGTAPSTYQRKHNPWVNWQDATIPLPINKLPASVNMPYAGYFPAAANFASLPTLCFVIPNQLHDMHDGTVAQGDTWLQTNLSAYANWCMSNNSLLIVTWDEASGTGNHIATIFHGPMVVPGQYGQTIDHYSLLRTLEDMFGLPHNAGSATATSITNIWVPTPTGVSFCSGDGSGTACPCGNSGAAGRGCASSTVPVGAVLTAAGRPSTSNDSVTLTASDVSGPGLFFQGDGQSAGGAGIPLGDGLLCAGGSIVRLGVVFPTAGTASYPGGSTPSPIHVAGAIVSGDVRHYQCWYRDSASFCTANTYNLTQGSTLIWGP